MLWCPTQGSCPSLGRGSGYLHEHHMQLPMGDKCPSQPLVSASPRLNLPFSTLGPQFPHSDSAFPSPLVLFPSSFSLCPFPSPEISLLHSLSSPSERADVGQLQHHSSQLGPLTLKDDKQRWEGLTSYRADLGPGAPLTRDLRGIQVQTSYV